MKKQLRFEETTLDGIDLDDYLALMGEEEVISTIDPSDPHMTVKCNRDGCWRQAYCARDELSDDLHDEQDAIGL
jgi:hypothetical protein